MWRFVFADSCPCRTYLPAHAATGTKILPDKKCQEFTADLGWTVLVVNVRFILMPEVFDRAQDRVWR